jgi:hypothetical protein
MCVVGKKDMIRKRKRKEKKRRNQRAKWVGNEKERKKETSY